MRTQCGNMGQRLASAVAGIALAAAVGGPASAGEPASQSPAATAREDPSQSVRDMETIRKRILDPLLGPVRIETVRQLVDTLQADGSWPSIDYQDRNRSSWKTVRHLSNVATLARAYKSPPSELRGDAALRKAVFSSLDYWLEHDFQNPNWWWNQIGAPRSLLTTLLLLDEELSESERRRGLAILARAKISMTGQNLVWVTEITAIRGILQNDPALVAKAYRRIVEEIEVTTSEGIQPDFSFHQHGPCLYSHGYGAAFASDCPRIAAQVAGTGLAFPDETIATLSRYLLDGSQWMARGSASDFGAEGREIARRGQSAQYLSTAAQYMLKLPTGREEEFRALSARALDRPAPPLEGNRHFWRSDVMTHHRAGFYASARMFSRRLANTDHPCNEEGLLSHHVADGCNVLLRTGREYRDIFPVWDWQKIPGTTVEQTPKLAGSPRKQGERSFVGGVSDGTYGMAAFDHVRGALAARKCWAFFDREYVCLGAGITCSSDHPVITTVNQCYLEGDVSVQEDAAARELAKGTHTLDNASCVVHDQVAYVFLEPARVRLTNDVQQGSWSRINRRYSQDAISRDVFTLWIDHGRGPADSTYAYLVAPEIDPASLASYAAEPPVRILQNEPEIQAVWHERLRIAGLAFYDAGRVPIHDDLAVEVDSPCLVLVRELADRLAVSVSNPENQESTVSMEIPGALRGEGVEVIEGPLRSRVTFDLPGGMDAGKSITRTLLRP